MHDRPILRGSERGSSVRYLDGVESLGTGLAEREDTRSHLRVPFASCPCNRLVWPDNPSEHELVALVLKENEIKKNVTETVAEVDSHTPPRAKQKSSGIRDPANDSKSESSPVIALPKIFE